MCPVDWTDHLVQSHETKTKLETMILMSYSGNGAKGLVKELLARLVEVSERNVHKESRVGMYIAKWNIYNMWWVNMAL